MSINKLVSVNHIIVNLMDSLVLDHNKYKPMFVNWAIRAEKKIGSHYSYKRKHAVLDIANCVAELPCEAVYVQRALLGDYGCDCADLFNNVCTSLANVTTGSVDSTSFLVVDLPSADSTQYGFVDHHVQDNKIIFNQNYDGLKVTVQYLGVETDKDGIPMVNENHLEAIEEYCMWQFKRRNPRSGIELGIVRDHRSQWNELVCEARGTDAEISDSERMRIANLLHDPLVGRGLPLDPFSSWNNL